MSSPSPASRVEASIAAACSKHSPISRARRSSKAGSLAPVSAFTNSLANAAMFCLLSELNTAAEK